MTCDVNNNNNLFIMADDGLLDVAAKSASFNVLLQVSLRLSSFALNGFVLRYVNAALLGVVNLRLTLLYNTILFLSREPLRKAALSRVTTDSSHEWRFVFNLMWLSIPVGVVIGAFLSLLWVSPLLQQPDILWDGVGVAIFFVSALIELSAEPLWVMAQSCQYVSIKVVAESTSQVVRCVIIAVGVVSFSEDYCVLVFSIGQLAYSLLYVVIYYGYFSTETNRSAKTIPIKSIVEIFPVKLKNKYQSSELLALSWSFFKQSFLKQLLTDGERYIMTILGVLSFAEQGVYDVVNNLGSLVARFLFLPIEESFYIFFARLLVRGEKAVDQRRESVLTASLTLSLLLKMVSIVGLIILVFGYNYSHLALDLYGGKVISDGIGPLLLQCYSGYVLFLAINGITECYMFAVMSQQHVDRYNRAMLAFSVIFLIASFLLTKMLGSVGFILANCVNMFFRILHSCHFIHHYFSAIDKRPLLSAVPANSCFISIIISFAITRLSEVWFCCDIGVLYSLIHIAIGGVCLLVVGVVIVVAEQRMVSFLIDRLPKRIQTVLHNFIPQKQFKDK